MTTKLPLSASYAIDSGAVRPSKATAMGYIEAMKTGRTLYPREVDELLLYFAPAAPKSAQTAFQWCAKAVADKHEVRTFLQFVHVEAGTMYGCNGHRMHAAPTDLGNGYYCPKTGAHVMNSEYKYPDVARLMECARKNRQECDDKDKKLLLTSTGREYAGFGTYHINADYLDATMHEKLYIASGGQFSGTSKFGDFVVMGIRTSKSV